MSQVRIPVSRDESREAQQRSRARHREYVADLESRVKRYEQQGVSATLEMQRAARAVVARNARLLALLRLRGVQQHEIDAFLALPETHDAPEVLKAQTESDASMFDSPNTVQPCSVASSTTASPETVSSVQEQETSRRNGCSSKSNCGPSKPEVSCTRVQNCNPPAAALPMDSSRQSDAACAQAREETSCEEAAFIIASLRGHGDVIEARQTLGCADNSACSVKNTHLFQLMNDMS